MERCFLKVPFCHAERGFMYYYALINENNVCTAVYAMPAPLSGESYVTITEEQYTSQSVIGMKYDNGEWVEVTVYYYAILNDKGIVTNVYQSETEMAAADNLVQITLEQYNDASLVGKYYDRENNAFIDAPISVLKEHSTNEIQYKAEEKWLSDKLDEIEAAIAAISTGTGMSAAEILTVLLGVDGAGSGLDADKLDGKEAAEFAAAEHAHEGYAAAEHTHDGYAATDHTHAGYAPTEHTHDGYAASNHTHEGYAATDHTHSNYAASSHSHAQSDITGLASALAAKADSSHTHSGYAASSHSHAQSEITGLTSALASKADSSHTHSGYAASSHSHSDYFEKAGGTISGETNFSGGLVRTKGTQTLFNSGTMINFGSGNLPTNICGEAIYSTKSITVSSDERLKSDVKKLDKQALIDFMKQIELVSYRYNEEPEGTKHIGVIAQQLYKINPTIAKYFVSEKEDGYFTVDYSALALLAVLALQ